MLNVIWEFWEVKGEEEIFEFVFDVVKIGIGYCDVVVCRKVVVKGMVKWLWFMCE